MKEKNSNKLNFIKIKNFCFAKGTVKKMKRQATDQKKMFAKHIAGKGLVYKICKEFSNLNSKKTNHACPPPPKKKKWATDQNRHCTKEDKQIANKHMKEFSTQFFIMVMQIKQNEIPLHMYQNGENTEK